MAKNENSLELENIKNIPEQNLVSKQDDLKSLLEKNIKWSQAVYEQTKKINRRITWMVAGSYFHLLLILAPIILAIIFLPPILSDLWSQYGQLLGSVGGAPGAGGINTEQILKMLNDSGIKLNINQSDLQNILMNAKK